MNDATDKFKNTNAESSSKENSIQNVNKKPFQIGFQTAKGSKISIKEESINLMKNKLFSEENEPQANVN